MGNYIWGHFQECEVKLFSNGILISITAYHTALIIRPLVYTRDGNTGIPKIGIPVFWPINNTEIPVLKKSKYRISVLILFNQNNGFFLRKISFY